MFHNQRANTTTRKPHSHKRQWLIHILDIAHGRELDSGFQGKLKWEDREMSRAIAGRWPNGLRAGGRF